MQQRQTVLRVVGAQSPAELAEHGKTAIITTTDSDPFEDRFAKQLGRSVFVCRSAEDAFAALRANSIDMFFADFRSLDDKWTGHRFLKHVRLDRGLSSVTVYLMANTWHTHQEQWAVKCGAKGFIKRSPNVLAQQILGEVAQPRAEEPVDLNIVDSVFGAFAGPMRRLVIERCRDAFNHGLIAPSVEAYVAELSIQIGDLDCREQFLEAAMATVSKKKGLELDADAYAGWETLVDTEYKRFAGALAFRLVVPALKRDRHMSGNHDKAHYVLGLAKSLSNPIRRSEFLEAIKAVRLIG